MPISQILILILESSTSYHSFGLQTFIDIERGSDFMIVHVYAQVYRCMIVHVLRGNAQVYRLLENAVCMCAKANTGEL
jgi:hypothetical protein